MCGLVGVAGDIGHRERGAFKTLLLVDSLRGEDSTGVAIVSTIEAIPPAVIKRVGPPHTLFDSKKYDIEIDKFTNMVLLGHNRSTTRGGTTETNAHPFMFEKVVGAHNGTLSISSDLDDYNSFNVDSEALFYNIDKDGPEIAIPKTSGSWALTWWNIEDRTLHFIRNPDRPLAYCITEDKKTIFWASEPSFLIFALARASIKHQKVYAVAENILYTWKGIDGASVIKEPTKSPLLGKLVEDYSLNGGYNAWGHTYQGRTIDRRGVVVPFTGKIVKKKEDDSIVGLFGTNSAVRKATKELFKKKGVSDCCNCGDPLELNEDIVLLGSEEWLSCMDCIKNVPELTQLLRQHPDFFDHPTIN